MDASKSVSIAKKLRLASEGFKISVALSFIGIAVELAVLFVTPSIILMTDLLHWSTDTALELVFLLAIYFASRVGKRFPLSVMFIESVVIVFTISIILSIYGYFFIDYVTNIALNNRVSSSSLLPLMPTVIGATLTIVMLIIQRRSYERYGIELSRIDALHALIDTVAASVACIGIALTYYTNSVSVELLFTFILMFFVIHSLIEVFKDAIKTVLGLNIDYGMQIKIRNIVESKFKDIEVKNVEARKIGSFYLVTMDIAVDPITTVAEIHRLRKLISNAVLTTSDLIYHIDIKFYPKYIPLRQRSRLKSSSRLKK